jgi:hypothetical protein
MGNSWNNPPEQVIARINRLIDAANSGQANDRQKIITTLDKILDECTDATYDIINNDAVLVGKLAALGIECGYDDDAE